MASHGHLLWVSAHAHMRIPGLTRHICSSELVWKCARCLLVGILIHGRLRVHPRLLRDWRSIWIVLKLSLLQSRLILLSFLRVTARFSTARHCQCFQTGSIRLLRCSPSRKRDTRSIQCSLFGRSSTESASSRTALEKTATRNSDLATAIQPLQTPSAQEKTVLILYSIMPKSGLAQELLKVGQRWPTDILRPRLQYGNFLVALSNSKEHQKGLTPELLRSQHRLIENRLKDKYALSEKMMVPASYPDKYAKLVTLLEEAAESSELGAEEPKGLWSRITGR